LFGGDGAPAFAGRSVPVTGVTSRIPFLVVGGALLPDTDLGFWSALSVPYAIATVLLAVFAPRGDDMTTRPDATPATRDDGCRFRPLTGSQLDGTFTDQRILRARATATGLRTPTYRGCLSWRSRFTPRLALTRLAVSVRSVRAPGIQQGVTPGLAVYESGWKPYLGHDGKMVEAVCFWRA
jgi:hypothetical protein